MLADNKFAVFFRDDTNALFSRQREIPQMFDGHLFGRQIYKHSHLSELVQANVCARRAVPGKSNKSRVRVLKCLNPKLA